MKIASVSRAVVHPLRSRKVRVALATVITAYLVDSGLEVSPELVLTILGVGMSLILGIAHEDAGARPPDRTGPAGPASRPVVPRLNPSTRHRS